MEEKIKKELDECEDAVLERMSLWAQGLLKSLVDQVLQDRKRKGRLFAIILNYSYQDKGFL